MRALILASPLPCTLGSVASLPQAVSARAGRRAVRPCSRVVRMRTSLSCGPARGVRRSLVPARAWSDRTLALRENGGRTVTGGCEPAVSGKRRRAPPNPAVQVIESLPAGARPGDPPSSCRWFNPEPSRTPGATDPQWPPGQAGAPVTGIAFGPNGSTLNHQAHRTSAPEDPGRGDPPPARMVQP